ncbi:hypothetical protein, partial [Escherichia coli]|uniref:hypothetical protein n=1 Tax=Escherichia coli TaxID=562 RepID=UPI00227E6E1F
EKTNYYISTTLFSPIDMIDKYYRLLYCGRLRAGGRRALSGLRRTPSRRCHDGCNRYLNE